MGGEQTPEGAPRFELIVHQPTEAEATVQRRLAVLREFIFHTDLPDDQVVDIIGKAVKRSKPDQAES